MASLGDDAKTAVERGADGMEANPLTPAAASLTFGAQGELIAADGGARALLRLSTRDGVHELAHHDLNSTANALLGPQAERMLVLFRRMMRRRPRPVSVPFRLDELDGTMTATPLEEGAVRVQLHLMDDDGVLQASEDGHPAIAPRSTAFDIMALMRAVPHGVGLFDRDLKLVACNAHYGLASQTGDVLEPGMSHPDILKRLERMGRMSAEQAEAYLKTVRRSIRENRPGQHRHVSDGGLMYDVSIEPCSDGGYVVFHQNVTAQLSDALDLEEKTAALEQQSSLFRTAMEQMVQGLAMYDGELRLVTCNSRFLTMYNLPAELGEPGKWLGETLRHETFKMAKAIEGPATIRDVMARLEGSGEAFRQTLLLADGRYVGIQVNPTGDGGFVATHLDVTELRERESRERYLARHDGLTGLANRRRFSSSLTKALARADGKRLALLCLDLDHFKQINDTYGHEVGDHVLKEIAERIRNVLHDGHLAARIGGDEFCVLMEDVADVAEAKQMARTLIDVINRPMVHKGRRLVPGTSIGIAFGPDQSGNETELMRFADLALYAAKEEGRGKYSLFETAMQHKAEIRHEMQEGLALALERNEFRLSFQPALDVQSKRIVCFEADVTWIHPVLGPLEARRFLDAAMETGLIVPIGRLMLREAAMAARCWPDHVCVSVNLYPAQFVEGELEGAVQEALSASRIKAARLELKVSEALLLGDEGRVVKVLHKMRALGVRISLDRFGSGYAALQNLQSFPFDRVKVDGGNLTGGGAQGAHRQIMLAMLKLGRSLGVEIDALGVENDAQFEFLASEGCRTVQGSLFAPPLPERAAAELLDVTERRAARQADEAAG